jgi:ABC-type sugar transport system ATPase subunit
VAGTATNSLRLQDVRVERAGHTVLGPVSFTVPTGETVVVAGKAGFGGTTLARVIAGTVHPETGQVYVGDEDVTEAEPAQRHTVGYLPAGGGLLPHMDIESNIQYGLRLRGEEGAWLGHRVRTVVRALDLEPSLKLRPHHLSPGGRFRAAIARIAVRDPAPVVWVVDATRGGHVGGLRELLARVLPDRVAEPPGVLICVTGDSAPAMIGEADRLLVVRDGKIVRSGAPGEMQVDPPDLLTAMLVLPPPLPVHVGRIAGGWFRCGRMVLPCPPWPEVDRKVSVAMPRTALSLRPARDSADVDATVVDVKPEGARAWVVVEPVDAPEDRWWVEHWGDGWWPRPQRPVGVRVDPDGLLFFDIKSGDRIRPG